MKKIFALVLALVLLTSAALAETLVIGATVTPHSEILEHVKDELATKGIELEIVIFDDYVQPNENLFSGDLDANYFQHVPYLVSFNESHDMDLQVLGAVHYEPMGIYAGKAASLEDLKEGVTIGIPNDPSNEVRALELIAALGYITLPETYDTTLTPFDLTKEMNPLAIEFVEVNAEQLPRQLADFDFAVINSNYALAAGVEVTGVALASEGEDVAYPNIIAVRNGETREALTVLLEVLQSDETAAWISQTYGTAVIPTTVY